MAGVSQRISKKTVMRRQTGLGVVGAAQGQIMRRTSSVFKASRAMFTSKEIVSHHQSTGASYGLRSTDGTLAGELSAKTYQMQIEAMLEKIFTTAATLTASDIAAVGGATPEFTSGAGAFLTSGFKIGMVVKAANFGGGSTNSNGRNFWITALTGGSMVGVFLDNGAIQVADAAGEAVTLSEVGKRCLVPMTGHVKQYLQVEEWYGDTLLSDLFDDVIVASLDFDLPASGNAAFNSSYVGLARALAITTPVITAPTAETTTGIMSAINGRLFVQGVTTPITGLKISIKNSAANTGAEVGSNSPGDVTQDVIEVSGQFTAMLRDSTISALYEAETPVSIASVLVADESNPLSDFMAFTIGRVKITGDAPDDNTAIMRTYPFTAEINPLGTLVGPSLAWDETIITIQDSAAV